MDRIFFTDGTGFTLDSGMNVRPIECELKDGRTGFYLGVDWKDEIESRGITTEPITKDDIKVEEIE